MRTRSSSLPSISYAISSLTDSANCSYNEQSDNHEVQYRSRSITEQQISDASYSLDSQQSSTTCVQKHFSIDEENDEKQIMNVKKRFSMTDIIEEKGIPNTRSVTREQKRRSG
jgi:hypothetical protein